MVYFKEEQSFASWVRYLMIGTLIFVLATLVFSILNAETPSESMEAIVSSVISLVLFLAVMFLIFSFRINSNADDRKFTFRIRPLGIKKQINWEEVEDASIYKYNKIGKFPGGWGIRWNFKGETFYTASGYDGIRFKMKNGKTMVVGTNKVEEAQTLIDFWRKNYG